MTCSQCHRHAPYLHRVEGGALQPRCPDHFWPDVRVYGPSGRELIDWGRDRYILEAEDHLEERRRRRRTAVLY